MAPIFDIMRVAAKTELKIPEMLQNMLNARVQGMMAFVNALTKNGSLREVPSGVNLGVYKRFRQEKNITTGWLMRL